VKTKFLIAAVVVAASLALSCGDDDKSTGPVFDEDWRLLVQTGDGLLSCTFDGETEVLVEGNVAVEVLDGRIFVPGGSGVREYDREGNEIATYSRPAGISWGYLAALPGDRFAVMNNGTDTVNIFDDSGNLLASLGMLDEPGSTLQMCDGVVVGNKLIICEDGHNNLMQVDLDTYEMSLFKDLTDLEGWLGSIDYADGIYYLTQSKKVWTFTESGNPELLYEFTDDVWNIVGSAVAGGYIFITQNFEGKLWRVNINSGAITLVVDGLDYPQDLALLKD
jgi:hypothetical protein